MITSLPTKRISVISQLKSCLRVLPTRWRRKPAGIAITSLTICIAAAGVDIGLPVVSVFVSLFVCLSVLYKMNDVSTELSTPKSVEI